MLTDAEEVFEACRICGIFYLSSPSTLRPIFKRSMEDQDMPQIQEELNYWKIQISEDDGLPQKICTICLYEFQKHFKFLNNCVKTQEELYKIYVLKEQNLLNIKKEPINEEEGIDFFYVDDLSEEEGENTVTPFNFPHMPIKSEFFEEATIPRGNLTDKGNLLDLPEQAHQTVQNIYQEIPTTEINNAIKCWKCPYISRNDEEHKAHLQRIHDVSDLECHLCGKVFKHSNKQRLKFHLKWHKLNNHVKCTLCGFSCSSRSMLKEHKNAMHLKIKCCICSKEIPPRKFKFHMREHARNQETLDWKCYYCPEEFVSETELENHIWKSHAQNNIEEKPPITMEDEDSQDIYDECEILCAKCEKTFTNIQDLQIHAIEEHSGKLKSEFPTEANDTNDKTENMYVSQYEDEDEFVTDNQNNDISVSNADNSNLNHTESEFNYDSCSSTSSEINTADDICTTNQESGSEMTANDEICASSKENATEIRANDKCSTEIETAIDELCSSAKETSCEINTKDDAKEMISEINITDDLSISTREIADLHHSSSTETASELNTADESQNTGENSVLSPVKRSSSRILYTSAKSLRTSSRHLLQTSITSTMKRTSSLSQTSLDSDDNTTSSLRSSSKITSVDSDQDNSICKSLRTSSRHALQTSLKKTMGDDHDTLRSGTTDIIPKKDIQIKKKSEFICNICKRSFHYNISLNRHMKRHKT